MTVVFILSPMIRCEVNQQEGKIWNSGGILEGMPVDDGSGDEEKGCVMDRSRSHVEGVLPWTPSMASSTVQVSQIVGLSPFGKCGAVVYSRLKWMPVV